jgi:hypothetical protein
MIPKGFKRLAEMDFPIPEVSRHAAEKDHVVHKLATCPQTVWVNDCTGAGSRDR